MMDLSSNSCNEVSVKQCFIEEQSEKQPKSKVFVKSLYEQKTDGMFCDVELYVQGSVILCHACVLVSCSSYFMKCLQNNSSNIEQPSHWCSKQPLVIDLARLSDDTENFCLDCVSQIIDFMYLREIIMLDGHYNHFSKIIQFLEVYDLIHLSLKYFTENQSSVAANCASKKSIDENGYTSNKINKTIASLEHISPRLTNKSCIEPTKTLQNDSHILSSEKSEKQSLSKAVVNKDVVKKTDFLNKTAQKHNTELDVVDNENVQSSLCSDRLNEASKQARDISNKAASVCHFPCCSTDKNSFCLEAKKYENRRLICRLCSQSCFSARKMVKHMENAGHFGTECPVCFWKTENVNDLKLHVKDHNHSKPYKCHVCSKRHRFWEYHKLHLKVHCRNKKFLCELCQKSFQRHYNLTVHRMTHEKKYFCKNCDFSTCSSATLKSHILQHNNENLSDIVKNQSDCEEKITLNIDLKKYEEAKKFNCHICEKGFTQKKNLMRHVNLNHSNTEEYKCFVCDYKSKRSDLLRHHMKKHHQGLSIEFEKKKLKKKSATQQKETSHSRPDIVGVLIPVQLVSTSDTSTVDAFAVQKCAREPTENGVFSEDIRKGNNNENVKITSDSGPNQLDLPQPGTDDVLNISNRFTQSSNDILKNNINLLVSETSSLSPSTSDDSQNIKLNLKRQDLSRIDLKSSENSVQTEMNCFNNTSGFLDIINNINSDSKKCNSINLSIDKVNNGCSKNIQDKAEVLNGNEDIWLNEATGELLSGSNFLRVLIDSGCNLDPDHQMTPVGGNTSLELRDHLQTILNDAAEEKDDVQSNPNTPQANLVDFDDLDSVFPWNHLDASFCSTWVLNEATGELNMVSFDVQHLKNSDELKFDENTGFSSIDDDETALFLNEGTGDLSVIYFNPNRNEPTNLEHILDERFSQENIETLSEHSNDDDDVLNEEFLAASANFMAHNGNETFLNELTGEFDIAHFNNYHPATQEPAAGFESIHLNEETGEISWNILDQDVKTEFFENTERLSQDVDDSVNCDEFEPFSTEMSDFSSLFQLDTNTGDWQIVEETCGTLLNECTGEIVKKSE